MFNKALAFVAAVLGASILGSLLAVADAPIWLFIMVTFSVGVLFYSAWEGQ